MKKTNFGHKFLTLLAGIGLLLILAVDVSTQTRGKKNPNKTTSKPSSTKTPVKTKRGAGENDGNKPLNSGLDIEVGNPTFETPFFEKCPKQNSTSEKAICVGIGGGSDQATPEEIEQIHKTVSRIFYGKRFVMVRLTAVTIPNQQDEAKSKGCEFFIQTLYKSPFLKDEDSTSVWEKIAGLTTSQLPKAIGGVKIAVDNTKTNSKGQKIPKSESEIQSSGKKVENATQGVLGTAGEYIGKIPFFKRDRKFEMTFNFYRLDDITKPFVSLQRESKIQKNANDASVANLLYNLMRESTEKMQFVFLNPEAAQEIVQDPDKKKKDKNKKDKN